MFFGKDRIKLFGIISGLISIVFENDESSYYYRVPNEENGKYYIDIR